MKILIITPFYYIEGRSDLRHDTNAIHYFAKYWGNNNEVKVFNVYPHSYRDLKRYLNKENRYFYRDGYVFNKDNIEICIAEVQKMPGQKGNYNYLQCRHIINIFQKWNDINLFCPDVILVHVPSYVYNFIEKIKKYYGINLPCIGILHKTDIEEIERDTRVRDHLEEQFNGLYARSHGIRKKATGFGLSNLNHEIIQSGIPQYQSIGKNAPYSIENQLRLIYVGKLIPRKRVDTIIEAVSKLENKNVHLEIIGEGIEEKRLRNIVNKKKLHDQIHFIGKIPREQVFSYMANANLFCMPSYSETLGLTYLEAMSVGCVPIGTLGEGIDGIIVDGKNGYLVDPSNVVYDLIKKIQSYCALSDLDRKMMSIKAKESVRELDEPKCAQIYLDIVKRSVNNARDRQN